MKRAVRALVAAGMTVTAGTVGAEVRLGVSGGLNVASLEIEDLSDDERDSRTAAAIGAVLAWRPGEAWSVELRPAYVARGAKVLIQGSQVAIEAALFELPLLVTRDLGKGRVRPYLLAGAALAHLTSAKAVLGSVEEDILDDFERTDASLRAGAGLRMANVSGQPFVEVEYTHGLTDLNAENAGLGAGVGAIQDRGVQIRGGFSFGLK
jgi:hypothetical protein